MASISTFSEPANILKAKFEVNFGSGFVDYTAFLVYFNFFQELSEVSYGICETSAVFELKVPNPDASWTKKGLPVKYTISITDDNGLTYFDYVVFEGKTDKKTTITNRSIKMTARDTLYELLAKNPPFRGHFDNVTLLEIASLINNTHPGQLISFTDRYNNLVRYLQSDDDNLRSQVLEFAKISSCLVIYENNTIKFVNPREVAVLKNYTVEGDIPLSRIKMDGYNLNAKLDKNEYFNVFKATGYNYINSSNYFEKIYSGISIPSATEFFFEIDLGTTLAINLTSEFFTTNDIDADLPQAPIGLAFLSRSIIANNKILYKLYNQNGFTIYIRRVRLVGLAIIQTGTFTRTWTNTPQITADGERITFEIDCKVAQKQNNLDNLIEIQQAFTGEYYEFKCGWSPNFKVGKVITTRTPGNVQIRGLITKVEAEHIKSLTATIRIRQFLP